MNINKTTTVAALALVCISSLLSAARNDRREACAPTPPATCYPDDCCRVYCLGPENYGVNSAVRPRTCNGDWVISISGLYWNAHQDGMEYAIDTEVNSISENNRVDLIDAKFKSPHFKWDFGFKFGLGYNTTCDGWDFQINWTRYQGKACSHDEAELDDNHTLLPIWSNFAFTAGDTPLLPIFATDIETNWGLDLNWIDLELGREFWNSHRLSIRPHVGLRIALVNQDFEINHKGGSWSDGALVGGPQNNQVKMSNDFKSIGLIGGLDTVWNLGCGWAFYGDTALSLVYGRFLVKQDEYNRQAVTPFDKTKLLEIEDCFRATRLIVDLALGLQWATLFCECKYGLTLKFGWESHLFLDQNQLWRINKTFSVTEAGGEGGLQGNFINNFYQRRGDLDVQGWTLTVEFDF